MLVFQFCSTGSGRDIRGFCGNLVKFSGDVLASKSNSKNGYLQSQKKPMQKSQLTNTHWMLLISKCADGKFTSLWELNLAYWRRRVSTQPIINLWVFFFSGSQLWKDRKSMKRIVLSETFQTIAVLILLGGWLLKFAYVGFEVSQLSRINNYGALIGILILINLLWLRTTKWNQYLRPNVLLTIGHWFST